MDWKIFLMIFATVIFAIILPALITVGLVLGIVWGLAFLGLTPIPMPLFYGLIAVVWTVSLYIVTHTLGK